MQITGQRAICLIQAVHREGYELRNMLVNLSGKILSSLLQLDLGRAGRDNQSLNYLVTDIMPNSIKLLLGGILLAIVLDTAFKLVRSIAVKPLKEESL
ncbi:MAG: hypothetical protein ACM3TR_10370 [Caulobacteraceae bacterium]